MDYARLRQDFRKRIEKQAVLLPGAFNALSAKLAERAGFQGLYISGAALSAGQGLPDLGLLTLSEFTGLAKPIARAVKLPCLCDADTGFGEAINVMRTVREYEAIGLCGLHIEDQVLPKRCGHLPGKQLVSPQAMAEKIRMAVESRTDKNFLIIARTDARAVEGMKGALKRAEAYVKAGADAVFPEALESVAEFKKFAKEIRVPLLANMTEFGVSPQLTFDELESIGYRMVIFPVSALRVAMKAVEKFYRGLAKQGTQAAFLGEMQTRKELYDLIDYERYEALDRRASKAGTRGGGKEKRRGERG
jgi:methylisocitrate lyase